PIVESLQGSKHRPQRRGRRSSPGRIDVVSGKDCWCRLAASPRCSFSHTAGWLTPAADQSGTVWNSRPRTALHRAIAREFRPSLDSLVLVATRQDLAAPAGRIELATNRR